MFSSRQLVGFTGQGTGRRDKPTLNSTTLDPTRSRTYKKSSEVTQCVFLITLRVSPVSLVFVSDSVYGPRILALRCFQVQFPTTLTTRTNIKTNVVLQALSWKGQRVLFKGPHRKVKTQGSYNIYNRYAHKESNI